ncbi:MAG: glycosyltransferase family 4 protein [Bauldia sp.]
MEPLRILVVSHGHPKISLGGAEVASHNLHKGLNAVAGVSSAFLARVGTPFPRHADSALMSHGLADNEILFHTDRYDHFMLSSADTDDIGRDLVRYVEATRPHVIHFHHVIGLGLESLYAVREAAPDAALLMTFHEYLALCHHHGQMVKKGGALCTRSTPIDCSQCFPDIAPAKFLRREKFIRGMLELCDHFVSPSHFLADRYVAWGLPAERISVIENGLDIAAPAPARALSGPEPRRSRFAFFGQMIEFKGADVLLDAVARVPAEIWGSDARAMIFGGHIERAPPEYRERIAKLELAAAGRAQLYGAYRNDDMPRLMQSCDWVVVPSTWWENSPVVIQEAFFHGRPVIASNLGGMAEKITDGIDGMHFRARSAEDLADRLIQALTEPGLWERLRGGIRRPMNHVECAEAHLDLYRDVLRTRSRPAARGHYDDAATIDLGSRERRVAWPAL